MNLAGAMSMGMLLVLSSALLQSAANLLMRGGVRRIESFSLAPDRIVASLFMLGSEPLFMSGAVFYDFEDWRMNLQLRNLGDEEYGRRGFGAGSFIPADGRSVFLSAELRK